MGNTAVESSTQRNRFAANVNPAARLLGSIDIMADTRNQTQTNRQLNESKSTRQRPRFKKPGHQTMPDRDMDFHGEHPPHHSDRAVDLTPAITRTLTLFRPIYILVASLHAPFGIYIFYAPAGASHAGGIPHRIYTNPP